MRQPKSTDVSMDQVMNRSVRGRTEDTYKQRANGFEDWLDKYRANGHYVPKYSQLRERQKLIYWANIVSKYLLDLFNDTHNVGKTLLGYLDALLHHWAVRYQVYLNRSDFRFLKKSIHTQ